MNTPRPDQPTVPVEEFFNAQSAEITTSGRALQRQLADALTQTMAPLRFVPLDITSANTAQWALLPVTPHRRPVRRQQLGKWVRLQVAMVESSTGRVLTACAPISMRHSSMPSRQRSSRMRPCTSPTSATRSAWGCGRSGRVIDGELLLQSAVSDAIAAYEAGRYDDAAERAFVRAKAMSKDHPAALTGLYQTYWKRGARPTPSRPLPSWSPPVSTPAACR